MGFAVSVGSQVLIEHAKYTETWAKIKIFVRGPVRPPSGLKGLTTGPRSGADPVRTAPVGFTHRSESGVPDHRLLDQVTDQTAATEILFWRGASW